MHVDAVCCCCFLGWIGCLAGLVLRLPASLDEPDAQAAAAAAAAAAGAGEGEPDAQAAAAQNEQTAHKRPRRTRRGKQGGWV